MLFRSDANGDSRSANDLFYVPNGPGDVIFPNAEEEAAFFAYLDAHPEINKYRGRVAPANSFNAKFLHNFDVRLTQEIPGFMDGHKAEFTFDIMNIGNLIDKDWGQIDDYGFFSTQRIANFAGIDPATGKYVYRFNRADATSIQEVNGDGVNTGVSRWSVQATFRYKF